MADQGIWFKLWDGWENDADLANLSKEDLLHWVLLGGYLKKHGNNGMTCITKPALALQRKFMVGSYEEVIKIVKKFPNCVLEEKQKTIHENGVTNMVTDTTIITLRWRNWRKYQGDSSKHRTRDYRSRFFRNDANSVTPKKRREEIREDEKRRENTPKPPSNRFQKPTPQEVTDYAKTIGFLLNGNQFCDYYETRGWQIGKTPMKDWQAAVRTWKRNDGGSNGTNDSTSSTDFKALARAAREAKKAGNEVTAGAVSNGIGNMPDVRDHERSHTGGSNE